MISGDVSKQTPSDMRQSHWIPNKKYKYQLTVTYTRESEIKPVTRPTPPPQPQNKQYYV